MKKTFFTITLLLFSLILISCKKDDKEVTHQEIFDSISIGYEVGDSSLSVTKDINLPTETTFEGVTLKWTSANINIISSTGEVTRPSGNNVTVLLILEVTINGIKDEKSFPITVIGTNPVDPVTKFTVTFNSDGGSTVSSVEVLENGLVTKPTNPTKDGFDFVGWFIGDDEWNFSNSVVTKDITLLARWETAVPTFTVIFNSNGGTLVNSQVIKEGFVVNEPSDPVLIDFDFAGWFVDENLLVVWDFEEDLVTKDITLYAKWTPKVVYYDVLFDSNGGLPVEKITAEENTLAEAPQNPERDGYIFAGWYLNDSLFDFDEDLVTSSITLVASWYPEGVEPGLDTFLVTFETFAGSDIYPAIVADGHLLTEPVEPTLFDNAFEGWYVDEDLLTAWNFDEDLVTKDITLYAKWRTLPPALGTPIHAIVITPSNNYHVAIGPYDQAGNPAVGFGGKFELRFTNTTTSEVFNYEFTHDANVGIGIHAGDWANSTLSMGTYEVTYRALANNTTHRDSSWYSGSASFEVGPVQIAKPVPVLDENILTWSEVNNASSYNIIFNEVITENVSSPFNLDSLELAAGSYQLTLVAVGGEGYLSSEVIVSFVIKDEDAPNLDTPTNLVVDESGNLTWDLVSNATGYSILVEGQDAFDVEINEFDLNTLELAAGDYIITVVAKGDDISFLDSNESISVMFEVESAELTQLPAPVSAVVHTASTMHVAVGVYDGGTGYSGQLRFVWFDKVTNEPIASDLLNAPAEQGYAYLYENFLETLPTGTYIVRFQAVGDQVLGSDSEFSIHTFEVTKALPLLDDPVITLNETTASWNAVANATSYEVYVNDVLQTEGIVDLTFILPTEVGTYTIKVVALADGYQSSEADAEHIVVSEEAVQLDAPTNLLIDEETSVLSWDAVDHASGYRIILGTNIIDLGLVLSYDLSLILVSSGNHTVEVYALGDGVDYLNSDKAEIAYTAPEPTQQLLPITADAIQVANDPGHYFFLFHNNPAGQEIVNQEGWNGEFLIKVMQGDTVVLTIDDISFVAFGNQIRLHWGGKPGDDNFTGLPDGQYTISIQLVADGYMASDPYTYTLTW